ncbi:YiiX/YebB-like N1pC/P60 family cysteine hydrolase [Hyphomicrobium sp.]|uniref:YiiX/YebB-like N1pC/P60 family cysteine hydrolase n=1 Tax=Hyphomicrobium sp. TaxID=82 RepID=UPI002E33B52D|nr:YiiX/YebB-like N1pC/P60 family cysteine hydrolase [Hyphomicrobium sp.]HEX2841537.1 YiiX/YebB-like N1pC/P60 family cysteine hydrolase [Hyphomicrobium sp.]
MQRTVVSGLEERLARIGAVADQEYGTTHELEAALRSAYGLIHDTDLAEADRREVTHAAPYLMHSLFTVRMRLRDRIAAWQSQGIFARPAQNALRDVFRIARYASDMLGEIASGNPRLAPGEKSKRAFTGSAWNTLVHRAYETGHNIPFRSGDVLVMRGSAHNSAAIARIGDVDTQFSHTAIVYIDADGKHWLVEALIEDGAVINTLEHVLDHNLGRAVLYRFHDAAIAERAAKLAHARVLASKSGYGRHIPYDFTMRLKGRRSLFCAKLVAQAYSDATNGKVVLPAYKTKFDQRNNKAFFKSIGVRAKETYAPGDIDLDPRFDLVAEWQDYRLTPLLRRQDMVMTKFFEWMETRGYAFKEDFAIKLISVFGRLSSYLSDRAKNLISSVVPKVPRNMSRACVATIAMLHKSAEEVMPSLNALDDNHVSMTGFPLHGRDMLDHLERLREVSDGRIGYLLGPA